MPRAESGRLAVLFLLVFMVSGCYDFMKIMQREREIFQKNRPDASRFAPWQSDSIHYVTAGAPDSIAVVFVHGSPGSWDANAHLLNDSLLSRHFFLISPDRPGFGRSLYARPDGSLARQADALRAVLDHAGITGPVILAGHSWGGPIIVQFAHDFPGRTRALLNIAGSMDPALEKHRWYNRVARWRWVKWISPPDMTTSNEELWNARTELEQLLPAWPALQVPVITIQGLDDTLVPADNAGFVERTAPKGRVRTYRLPKEGHFVLWYRTDLIRQALLEAAGKPVPPSTIAPATAN